MTTGVRGMALLGTTARLEPRFDGALVREARSRVRAALDTRPKRDRMLLLLRHEGYSYRELAHAVNVAEGRVSIRVGDRMVFVRHGVTVHTDGSLHADGSYTISLSAGDPSSPTPLEP